MKMRHRSFAAYGLALAALPAVIPAEASALTLSQAVGLFHVAIGLLLTFTLGIFLTGVGLYLARLNTWPSYRDHAIKVMIRGVAMLFILILLIALVQFIQQHTAIALSILAVAAILAVLILFARAGFGGAKKEDKREAGPQRPH